MNKKKYLICGFIGGNNTGDEIILQNIIKTIKKTEDNDCEFIITSFKPKETNFFTNEKSIYWDGISKKFIFGQKEIFNIIKEVDKVIIGGGGLLQDVHSVRTIPRYLSIALIAQFFNKPVFYLSLGIGPIENNALKHLTKLISNDLQFISVRDKYSLEYLRELGVTENNINITSDPAVMSSEFFKNTNDKSNNLDIKIGISIREFNFSENNLKSLANFINNIMSRKKEKYKFVLFPMNKKSDLEINKKLKSLINHKNNVVIYSDYKHPKDIINKISEMDIMISMRLHGLIVSASFGIPSIGLIYDKKITNFLSQINMEDYLIDLNNFNDSFILEKKFNELLNNYNDSTKKIKFNIKDCKKEFSSTIEEIVSFKTGESCSTTNQIKNIYKALIMLLPLILNKIK